MKQTEFGFIVAAKERDELLRALSFESKRNRVLLAAILNHVAKFQPGPCFWSLKTFAATCKCSERGLQRAIKDLAELDLIVVERKVRKLGGRIGAVNHYLVNWTEVKRSVEARNSADLDTTNDVDQHDTSASTNTTLATDQHDTYERPTRHLEHAIEEKEQNKKTTTTELPDVVVVLSEILGRAKEAYRIAVARGLSDSEIYQLINSFRELPEAKQKPGVLYNWLTKQGSYEPPRTPTVPVRKPGGDSMSRLINWRSQTRKQMLRENRPQSEIDAFLREADRIEQQMQTELDAVELAG